jgi:hypothetical protein
MRIYDAFPEIEPPRELDLNDVAKFAEANVWPAATFFWGNSYKDPNERDNNEPISVVIESPDSENIVQLFLSLECGYEQQLDDNEDPGEIETGELYVCVSIETIRPDMNKVFKNSLSGLRIWEVCSYSFYLDGSEPEADRFYTLRDEDDEEIEYDRLPKRQKDMLSRVSRHQRFNPYRDAEINTQDIVDIHNILLALEVPEEIINLAEQPKQP